jgi:hypothetical protein
MTERRAVGGEAASGTTVAVGDNTVSVRTMFLGCVHLYQRLQRWNEERRVEKCLLL